MLYADPIGVGWVDVRLAVSMVRNNPQEIHAGLVYILVSSTGRNMPGVLSGSLVRYCSRVSLFYHPLPLAFDTMS
jgi:hypothetical protein